MPDPTAAPAPAPATPALSSLRIDRSAAPRSRRRRRLWPWVLLVVVIGGAAAWGLMPHKIEVQATSVVTAYPSQRFAQLAASGYVVAQRRAAVASKATGRLVELTVREGSKVRRGELIARIDAADVDAAMRSAEAGIVQAAAGVQQAQANARQAEVVAANAEADLARSKGLQAQGFVAPQAVDAAQARADEARAARGAAQAGLAAARAAEAQARTQVGVQQVNRANTEIRAPFDAVVLVKNANVGDLITPFSNASGTSGAVVTVADMGTLEVEADVSEGSVGRVHEEQPVEIMLDALPGVRFRGAVTRIVPTVDRAKATVTTKVRFEKLDPRILPEMSAKVSFLSQPAGDADQKPVIAVSPKAIVSRDGHPVVLRIGKDDIAEAVPVTPGRNLGDMVEVPGAALASGERLVLSPPEAVRGGSRLSVVTK